MKFRNRSSRSRCSTWSCSKASDVGGNGRKYPWHVARIGARGREAETKLGTDAHIRKLWFPWWASKPSLIIPSIFSSTFLLPSPLLLLSPNNFDCSPSKRFEFLLRPYPPRFAPFYFLQTWLESFHHIFWLRNIEAEIVISWRKKNSTIVRTFVIGLEFTLIDEFWWE